MCTNSLAPAGWRSVGRCRWPTAVQFAVLCLAGGAAGAQVLINPVVVELGARQRVVAVTITLSDKARAPMRLQTELLRWRQDVHGEAVTEPSDDILVTPPIAELRPGEKQLFRVTLRGPRPAPEELAYRLILEDISEAPATTEAVGGISIKLRMRYDLPVLVAPLGPVVNELRWKLCAPEAASAVTISSKPSDRGPEACVRLLNAGNRRVKVQTLTLTGEGWQQALPLKDGVNVLVGDEHEWRVPLQANQAGAVRGVQVGTARGETLRVESARF
jgi:fimbrial chaperone protein